MIRSLLFFVILNTFAVSIYAQTDLDTNEATSTITSKTNPNFDIQIYLDKCGGEIYPLCDSAELNQLTIYKEAEAVAKATGRSIFLIIGADWCGPCHIVHRALNSDPKIRAEIEEKFVIVNISGDERKTKSVVEVEKYLNIFTRAFPTFFRADPVTNKAYQILIPNYKEISSYKTSLINSDVLGSLENLAASTKTLSQVPVDQLDVPLDLDEKFGQYPYLKNYFGGQSKADKAINAGLARIHNFHYIDAVRAFKMAVNEEPNNDLARSFLALAYVKFDPQNGAVFANLELMKVRRGRMSELGQAWYDFVKSYVFTTSVNLMQTTDFLTLDEALTNLKTVGPDDLEVLTLAQYFAKGTSDHEPFYQALKIDPNHLGANHYLIHLHEESSSYQLALEHAEKMASLATDSSHAQHMLGHVLPRFKEWKKAKAQFDIAAQLHQNWAKKYSYELAYDWHYSHNLDLMAITYISFGEVDQAVDMFKASCQSSDTRGCESLLKIASAEGRVADIDWMRNYYLKLGADPKQLEDYLMPYLLQANFKLLLQPNSSFSEERNKEITKQAFDYAQIDPNDIQEIQNKVIQVMLFNYFARGLATPDQKEALENYEVQVIKQIFAYSEDRVGCSSFDGWGKGLLDTYRFYRFSQTLKQDQLSLRLKSILVNTLGIPLAL